MRIAPLAAVALLVLAPVNVRATGIDLNWDNCLFNVANRVGDKTFACDDDNAGPFQLYGSIRTGVAVSNILGWAADINITTIGFTDDWWSMGAGDCREGGIGFKAKAADMPNLTSCNKSLLSAGIAVEGSAYFRTGQPETRYRIGAIGTAPVTAVGSVKYQLFRIDLNTTNTVGPDGCQNCQDFACLDLYQIELHVPPSPQLPGGNLIYQGAEIATYVTWQRGSSSFSCPIFAVPTTRSTWGRVKSLYR